MDLDVDPQPQNTAYKHVIPPYPRDVIGYNHDGGSDPSWHDIITNNNNYNNYTTAFPDTMAENYTSRSTDNTSWWHYDTEDDARDESIAVIEVAVSATILFLAVAGNGCVLVSLYMRKRRRLSRMLLMILHLSLADLFVAFFNVLPQLAWDITFRFRGGGFMCKAVKYLQLVAMYASAYVLLATATDRYLAICHPFLSQKWTPRHAHQMVGLAWIASLVLSLPQLFIFSLTEVEEDVYDCWAHFDPLWTLPTYITWNTLSIFVVPTFALACLYGRISLVVWRAGRLDPESITRGTVASLENIANPSSPTKERNIANTTTNTITNTTTSNQHITDTTTTTNTNLIAASPPPLPSSTTTATTSTTSFADARNINGDDDEQNNHYHHNPPPYSFNNGQKSSEALAHSTGRTTAPTHHFLTTRRRCQSHSEVTSYTGSECALCSVHGDGGELRVSSDDTKDCSSSIGNDYYCCAVPEGESGDCDCCRGGGGCCAPAMIGSYTSIGSYPTQRPLPSPSYQQSVSVFPPTCHIPMAEEERAISTLHSNIIHPTSSTPFLYECVQGETLNQQNVHQNKVTALTRSYSDREISNTNYPNTREVFQGRNGNFLCEVGLLNSSAKAVHSDKCDSLPWEVKQPELTGINVNEKVNEFSDEGNNYTDDWVKSKKVGENVKVEKSDINSGDSKMKHGDIGKLIISNGSNIEMCCGEIKDADVFRNNEKVKSHNKYWIFRLNGKKFKWISKMFGSNGENNDNIQTFHVDNVKHADILLENCGENVGNKKPENGQRLSFGHNPPNPCAHFHDDSSHQHHRYCFRKQQKGRVKTSSEPFASSEEKKRLMIRTSSKRNCFIFRNQRDRTPMVLNPSNNCKRFQNNILLHHQSNTHRCDCAAEPNHCQKGKLCSPRAKQHPHCLQQQQPPRYTIIDTKPNYTLEERQPNGTLSSAFSDDVNIATPYRNCIRQQHHHHPLQHHPSPHQQQHHPTHQIQNNNHHDHRERQQDIPKLPRDQHQHPHHYHHHHHHHHPHHHHNPHHQHCHRSIQQQQQQQQLINHSKSPQTSPNALSANLSTTTPTPPTLRPEKNKSPEKERSITTCTFTTNQTNNNSRTTSSFSNKECSNNTSSTSTTDPRNHNSRTTSSFANKESCPNNNTTHPAVSTATTTSIHTHPAVSTTTTTSTTPTHSSRRNIIRRATSVVTSAAGSRRSTRTRVTPGISRAKLKTIKLTLTVVICYVICWLPFFAGQMWAAFDENAPFQGDSFTIIMLLASVNSCTNPWIYTVFSNTICRHARNCLAFAAPSHFRARTATATATQHSPTADTRTMSTKMKIIHKTSKKL